MHSIRLSELKEVSVKATRFHEDRFRKAKWGLSVLPSVSVFPVFQFDVNQLSMNYLRPKTSEVLKFLLTAFRDYRLPNELAILAVIYLERLAAGGTELRQWNWKPILLSALLVASKVWEDVCTMNVDISKCNSVYSLQAVSLMEHAFVDSISWRFIVKPQEYEQVDYSLKQAIHSDF